MDYDLLLMCPSILIFVFVGGGSGLWRGTVKRRCGKTSMQFAQHISIYAFHLTEA